MSQQPSAASPGVPRGIDPGTLTIGARFGRYEIVSPLGAGGMGEVYRARDTHLCRDVALKVLPHRISFSDPDRVARFEQEARSASALNHPNIITIYDLGEIASTRYIAMELIQGKTLRETLARGPVPLRQLVNLACQVADGLAKAHEAGIVHRDLKPENLMIDPEGLLKILDFGLAKLAPSAASASDMPTLAQQPTRAGTVVGTVEYMSPEQARGETLDFRSDQFSIGLVLYEMATGRRAFRGSSSAEVITSILRDRPEGVASLNPALPTPLCWIIERCLSKEPEKRYASTRDLARELFAVRDRMAELKSEPVETRPSNLPAERTPLVGRDQELQAAQQLLLRPDVRLLTVTGAGGIGKTRLALELASRTLERFPAGVYLVPLGAVGDPGLVASVLAQILGVSEAGSQSPLESVKHHLQRALRAAMLLVFDNFEHLAAAAPMLTELLAVSPNLKIVVTSRAALRVYGEHEFPVPPLALPDPAKLPSLETLAAYPAVALFLQRAAAVKPGFALTDENAPAVAEICARLDGLPLAIELAAARIKLLSPQAMRARLAGRLQLLTGGARDLPLRQQTLRATIDWSYDLLTPAEQKLFRRLSVFVGGCTLEAVEAVCNTRVDLELDILDGMASIADKGLVRQSEQEGEPRFIMLETVREYAQEKLAASGEEALTRRAHAAYCLVLTEEAAVEEDLGSEWSQRLETEHANLREALEYLTESGDADWGLRLGAALFRFWEKREYFAEGRERLAKLLSLKSTVASNTRARALFAAGVLAGEQADFVSSTALIQESLQIARALDDKRGMAVSLNALGYFTRDRGELAEAAALFEESLGLCRELGDRLAVARALSNLANVARLLGQHARSHTLYEESLAMFRALGDREAIAWSLSYQGDVARDQGDTAAARSFYQASVNTFREIGDPLGTAGALADLGNLASEEGDFAAAHSLFRESMDIFRKQGHKRGMARVLECFATDAAARSLPERALRLAGAAAAVRHSVGAPLTRSEQARLEKCLEAARRGVSNTAGSAAWLEGWAMPLEKAIEEGQSPH